MSKITKEEMLDWLDFWYGIQSTIASDEELRAYQAIYSLVEAYFKWQEEATLIRRKYPDNLLPAATAILLDRIRDFDFGFEVEEKR